VKSVYQNPVKPGRAEIRSEGVIYVYNTL